MEEQKKKNAETIDDKLFRLLAETDRKRNYSMAYPLIEKIKESIKKQYTGNPEDLIEIVVAYDVLDYRIFIKLSDGQEKELERVDYP